MFSKAFCVITNVSETVTPALSQGLSCVLYKPCSQWLRDAAADAGFLSVGENEPAEGEFEFGLALYCQYPFITAKQIISAYESFRLGKKSVLITANGQPAGVFADCAQLKRIVCGQAKPEAEYALDSPLPYISDAASHSAANEFARRREIERRLAQGVIIPFADGVIISPDAVIEAGAVIGQGTVIKGKSVIAEGAQVGPYSFVSDTAIGRNTVFNHSTANNASVGANATVGPYTQLRPDSVLGDKVKVGDFVEIKNSNIGNNTSVAHLTYIGDADVGKSCNFGCGVVVVNYDGENKYRTQIGDYSFIGCNTNLVAPVKVGDNAFTAAGATITRDVPDGALAISRVPQLNKEQWAQRKLKKYTEKQKNKE